MFSSTQHPAPSTQHPAPSTQHPAPSTQPDSRLSKTSLFFLILALIMTWTSPSLAEQEFLAYQYDGMISIEGSFNFGQSAAYGDFQDGNGPVLVVGAPRILFDSVIGAYLGGVFALYGHNETGGPNSIVPIYDTSAGYGELGFSVSFLADFLESDGVGKPVFAVGAPLNDDGEYNSGTGVQYHFDGQDIVETILFNPACNLAHNKTGSIVTSCDFNGDGYGDIVLGNDHGLATGHGFVYIYLGGVGADDKVDVVIEPLIQDSSGFGNFVAGVGNLNQDEFGFEDLAVCDVQSDNSFVYVVFGRDVFQANPDPLFISLSESSSAFGGIVIPTTEPCAVAGGADVTGDEELNLIISESLSGAQQQVSIYSGPFSQGGEPSIVSTITGGAGFGSKLSIDSDFNNDGIRDLLLGCKHENPRGGSGYNHGMVAIFLGGTFQETEVLDLDYSSTANRWYISPNELPSGALFGTTVGTMADQDGDGLDDIFVGAPGFTVAGETIKGKIYGISPTLSDKITITDQTTRIMVNTEGWVAVFYAEANYWEGGVVVDRPLEMSVSLSGQPNENYILVDDGLGWDDIAEDGIFTSTGLSLSIDGGGGREFDFFATSPWNVEDGDGSFTILRSTINADQYSNFSVGRDAIYPLPAGNDQTALLAVSVVQNQGFPIEEVFIIATEVGGAHRLALNDAGGNGDLVDGDGIWSASISDVSASPGHYSLPIYVRDDQGEVYEEYFGNLQVVVYAGPVVAFTGEPVQGMEYEGQPYSSVVIDSQGDGGKDVFVSIEGFPGALFLADGFLGGVPKFTPAGPQIFGGFPPNNLLGLAVADFDNDGDQDLFCASQTDPRLYRNDGTGNFEDVIGVLGIPIGSVHKSVAAAWGDYDLDGWLDLAVGTADCSEEVPPGSIAADKLPDFLLHNDLGTGDGFSDVSTDVGIDPAEVTNCVTVSWGDIDSNGYPDLFFGDTKENDLNISNLFLNHGDGTFSEEFENQSNGIPGFQVSGLQWADMNNDGHFDMILANQEMQSQVCLNDGYGFFDQASAYALDFSADERTAGLRVFDHDLDGRQDILFLSNEENGHPVLIGNLGSEEPEFLDLTPVVGLGSLGKSGGAIVADFSATGEYGILLGREDQNAGTGQLEGAFFLANPTEQANPNNKWLSVDLKSPQGRNNTMGIGAVVRVYTGDLVQTQQVDGGSGRGGQCDHTLVFGLGDVAAVDSLVINWPNGFRQVEHPGTNLPHLFSDQTILSIVPGTTQGSYEVIDVGVNFKFAWETNVATPAWEDNVIVLAGAPGCNASEAVLSPSSTNVEHTISRLSGGNFRHELKWKYRPCSVGCVIHFIVKSAVGKSWEVENPERAFTVKVCGDYRHICQ